MQQMLVGRQLQNGWTVTKKVEPKEGSTGGFFNTELFFLNFPAKE